jgi:hypothetical protein
MSATTPCPFNRMFRRPNIPDTLRLNVAHAYQIGSLHHFCRSRQQPTQFPLVSLRRFDRRRLISDLHTGTPTGGILVPALRSPAQRVAPAGVQKPPFPLWEYSQIQGQRLCGRERGIWKCEAAGLGFLSIGRGSWKRHSLHSRAKRSCSESVDSAVAKVSCESKALSD